MSMSLAPDLSLGSSGLSLLSQVLALSPSALFDLSVANTLYQERTGASATTPSAVGDVVGSMKNLGTAGGWAIAPSDAARPILRQSGSLYYLETDGVDDEMDISTITLSAPPAVVVAHRATGGPGVLVSGGKYYYQFLTPSGNQRPRFTTASTADYDFLTLDATLNADTILSFRIDADWDCRAQRNGAGAVEIAGASGSGAAVGTTKLFARAAGTFFQGRTYGIVLATQFALDDAANLSLVERYLAQKAGITL